MKVLMDPVYTGRAHTCSTSYVFWEIIEETIQARDDVFFYLMYPRSSEDSPEEMAFLQRHSNRVTLLPYDYAVTDRLGEAFKLNDSLLEYISPGPSKFWDWDVLLTSRISMIPFMRNCSGRVTASYKSGTVRQIIGIECMPIFSFRDTVPWTIHGLNDMPSLAAYMAADKIVVADLWTKREVQQLARHWLSPSVARDLPSKIVESIPVPLQRLHRDCPKDPFSSDPETPFNVVFTGRMTGTRNFKEVADVFRNHYSFPIGTEAFLKFIVSTNSQASGAAKTGEIDFMDIQKNNREQFHALLKTKAHVVVNLSTVEDFSLSTYEPLLFGVPVIVPDRPWTSFLGPTYPFRVKGAAEAYAMVKLFAEDYDEQMARFWTWEETHWDLLVQSERNVSTAHQVRIALAQHEEWLHKDLTERDAGGMYKGLVQELLDTGDEIVRPLEFANEKGQLTTTAKSWKGIPMSLRPNQHLLKVYANMMGFADTNEPGVMRRKQQ